MALASKARFRRSSFTLPRPYSATRVSPFWKRTGGNLNLLNVLDLPEVEVVVDASLVETTEHVQPRWVIMITMDAEDGELHREVINHVVRPRRRQVLKLTWTLVPENLLVEDL